MKMEIMLESTSNKLMVGIRRDLLMLEILSRRFFLKLNLSDRRSILTDLQNILVSGFFANGGISGLRGWKSFKSEYFAFNRVELTIQSMKKLEKFLFRSDF
nr:hypothetical protein [Tanacetum cinerariifolium]